MLLVWPLGCAINSYFSLLIDERDKGPIILTHQYLLIGCTLPLYLAPVYNQGECYNILYLYYITLLLGILSWNSLSVTDHKVICSANKARLFRGCLRNAIWRCSVLFLIHK